ncbi:IclR family transcriptional regulator [Pseudomonas sp. GB2N2]
MDKTDKDRQYVTALARGLQILRCFTHDRPELTARELLSMTGLPQPTVWRLCYTLEREGFLVCAGETNKMALGLPALALGYAALVRAELPKIALPYMQSLTERYRMGASLSVRDGLDMLYLQRTHGDFVFFNDPVGARRPLAAAPTGWACLVAYDTDERERVMEGLKAAHSDDWSTIQARINQAMEDYQAHGVILSIGVMHSQFNAVAVPIRTREAGKIYGLSASGLACDWPREKLLAIGSELVELAKKLSLVSN